jgi:hypothetical protein
VRLGRFKKKTAITRQKELDEARRLWQTYDQLSDERKALLGPRRAAEPASTEELTPEDRLAEEISFLRDGLLYWFYERVDRKRSRLFADLLESLLRDVDGESISTEECKSLIAEVRGDLRKAIRHRTREIELIRRLHEISFGQPGEEYIGHLYDIDDLSDRLDLLAILYHDWGKRDRALKVLSESRNLCELHGIPFDGADLWDDYQKETLGVAPNECRFE